MNIDGSNLNISIPIFGLVPSLIYVFLALTAVAFTIMAINHHWTRAKSMRWKYEWVFISFGGACIAVAIVLYMHKIPFLLWDILGELENDKIPADDVRSYAYAFGALAAALAVFATIPFQLIKVWMNERKAKTEEEGLITDRISKAVEQIGAEKVVKVDGKEHSEPNLEVRIGGLYALERISQDSLRDHIQIMEILTAYVRNNASIDDTSYTRKYAVKPREDIQIALTIIGRRSNAALRREIQSSYVLELQNTYLQNANLISAKLQGADLWDTSLRGAHLWRAKLQGVRIEGTKLQGANLMNAELDVDTLFRPEFPIQLAWKNIDISDIEVSKDHIQSTYGDASVTLPNGIARPSHWPKEKLSNKEFIDFFHKWRDEIMDSDID